MAKGFPAFKKPNIIILMTDQERAIHNEPALQDFPKKWVNKHLPNLNYLKQHGMTFKNAQISSCPCSPSRGALWTGLYPSTNGVLRVGDNLDRTPINKRHIVGNVLSQAGYRVVFKGKWHLSHAFDDASDDIDRLKPLTSEEKQTLRYEDFQMEHAWQLNGWLAPDGAGARVTANTSGGSTANNDGRFVQGPTLLEDQQSAIEFLSENQDPHPEQPFCLIISLVNPHDIALYPNKFESGEMIYPSVFENYKGFELPNSYTEDNLMTKPWVQSNYLNGKDGKWDEADALNFIKLYAYLHTVVDKHFDYVVKSISDALWDNTIVIRLSDHGELGMSHNGLRDKQNTVYREVLNVPLIFSNPKWIKEPIEVESLVELVDVLPTLAGIAGMKAEELAKFEFQGTDFSQTLLDPSHPTKDSLLFAYGSGGDKTKYNPPGEMNAIRCLRTSEWKYAVYYSSKDNEGEEIKLPHFQYELYHLPEDPQELTNLLPVGGVASAEAKATQKELHEQLTERMKQTKTTPTGWPAEPVPPYLT